ncbi:MAG: hypothetical protein IPK93_02780 [Solirubrobacterales bacterium]|nr:hypothetical protein [Solirubrobacterales bacterium]
MRNESGQVRLDWAELVVLGAKEKIRQIEEDRRASQDLRKVAADQIRNRAGDSDVTAADEVKRSGWISS